MPVKSAVLLIKHIGKFYGNHLVVRQTNYRLNQDNIQKLSERIFEKCELKKIQLPSPTYEIVSFNMRFTYLTNKVLTPRHNIFKIIVSEPRIF